MLTVSNTNASGGLIALTSGQPFAVTGATGGGTALWMATAMDLNTGSGLNTVSQESLRTATSCYMRGLSEHLRISTSTGLPWFHRRICFTSKDYAFYATASGDTPTITPFDSVETSNGWQRLFLNQYINSMSQTRATMEAIIFKGTFQKDWTDVLIAPVDSKRVTVKFDKTWTIKSGNTVGTVAERKLWHPMNATLVYDDDEDGVNQASSRYSTKSKTGMGDYYVYDIFTPLGGATSADILTVSANSTLYWHEK